MFYFSELLQSSVFKLHAALMHFAAVLAPLAIGGVLVSLNYQRMHSGNVTPSLPMANIHMSMFDIAWTIPLFGGFLQIMFWLFYSGNTTKHVLVPNYGAR